MSNPHIEAFDKAQESFYNGDLTKTRRQLNCIPLQYRERWIDSTLANWDTRRPEQKGNFYRLLTNDSCETRHGIIDPDMLEYCCPLDNGRNENEKESYTGSLGALDILPLEILQNILIEELDLGTLTLLRSTSSSFRRAIDELPQYRAIARYAPSSIRAALSLEVASAYSCKDLYDSLCTSKCSACGKFSAFLYVPRCQRTCYQCFTTEARFLPMRREHSKFYWSITSKDLETGQIPVARSLPGRYQSPLPTLQRSRLPLVDYDTGLLISLSVHGSVQGIAEAHHASLDRRWGNWERRALAKADDPPQNMDRLPPLPPYLATDDDKRAHANRFMCVIPFPWLNRNEATVEWGVACNGCKIQYDLVRDKPYEEFKKALASQRTLYSQKRYLIHFLNCPRAQKLYHDGYATKIVGGKQLYPSYHPVCDISGNIANREFNPHPLKNVTPLERGKQRWDKLKPVKRQKRSTAGKASTTRTSDETAAPSA